MKKVLNASSHLLRSQNDTDLSTLMDWVSYHETIARFTLRHWKHDAQRLDTNTTSIWSDVDIHVVEDCTVSHRDFQSSPTLATLAALGILSDICDTIPTRPLNSLPPEDIPSYTSFLRFLDWKIQSIQTSHKTGMSTVVEGDAKGVIMLELYQLAMLVYLNRVSGNMLNESKKTQKRIDKALGILSQLSSCERQFPIFILGCEARSDEQRAVVLSLMDRTDKMSLSRSFNHSRLLLQAVWAQDDLAEKEVNYWDKMTAVVSRCSILPSLV